MKKNRFIKVLVYLFAVALLGSGMAVEANASAPKKHVTINNTLAANEDEKKAIEAVLALYTDNDFATIKDDITMLDVFNAHKLVDKLSDSDLKNILKTYILKAQIQLHENRAKMQVYALYKDEEHTIIADGVTQKEIGIARANVEYLPAEALRVQLRVLVIIAQVQLDSREAVYALFTDDTHTTIKADLTQADIDKAKELVDILIDQWPIKQDLNKLIALAQDQLDERTFEALPQITPAEKMVYELFTDGTFTKLAPGVNHPMIEGVRSIIRRLYPTELNQYLMHLLDVADSLLP